VRIDLSPGCQDLIERLAERNRDGGEYSPRYGKEVRREHEIGVWLSGLDVVSADALKLRGEFYEAPPIICHLDRGVGAAIRRARTRLPGGGDNPVAIIRVPRERMIGTGIASSLIHEVGHQAAALLQLVESLRPVLRSMGERSPAEAQSWTLWERWIAEIVADFWSVARVGLASTMGLMGVVSLPRPFVFRMAVDDPHPIPWFRVKLSCAMGNSMYPHPQWARILKVWESLYPPVRIGAARERIFAELNATMPGFPVESNAVRKAISTASSPVTPSFAGQGSALRNCWVTSASARSPSA